MMNDIKLPIRLKRKREYKKKKKMQYISGLQKNKVKVLSQKSSIVTAMSMEFFFDPWEEKFENSIQKPVFKNAGEYKGIGSRWSTMGTPCYSTPCK